jgi:hypothetical protein
LLSDAKLQSATKLRPEFAKFFMSPDPSLRSGWSLPWTTGLNECADAVVRGYLREKLGIFFAKIV